jgi:hypothetical protein
MLKDCCVCCEDALSVQCVDPCGHLVSSTLAIAGEYRLEVDFLGQKTCIKKTHLAGEIISFPLTGLNENFYFVGKIYGPTGQLRPTAAAVSYDCIAFKTSAGCSDQSLFTLA